MKPPSDPKPTFKDQVNPPPPPVVSSNEYSSPLVSAILVDPDADDRTPRTTRHVPRKVLIFIAVVVLVLAAGLVVAGYCGSGSCTSSESTRSISAIITPPPTVPPLQIPTSSPLVSMTLFPTTNPTTSQTTKVPLNIPTQSPIMRENSHPPSSSPSDNNTPDSTVIQQQQEEETTPPQQVRDYIESIRYPNIGTAEMAALEWLEEDQIAGDGFFDPTTPDGQLRLRQRYALAVLYESSEGSRWDNDANWLTSTSECEWFGISCDSDVVVRLELDNPINDGCCKGNGLSGSIPDDLFLLTSLTLFDLGANGMTGTIPTMIGLMTSLTTLSLAGNVFTGEIPSQISSLTDLQEGFFHSTSLSGDLTTSLCLSFDSDNGDLWATCDIDCSCCTRECDA